MTGTAWEPPDNALGRRRPADSSDCMPRPATKLAGVDAACSLLRVAATLRGAAAARFSRLSASSSDSIIAREAMSTPSTPKPNKLPSIRHARVSTTAARQTFLAPLKER